MRDTIAPTHGFTYEHIHVSQTQIIVRIHYHTTCARVFHHFVSGTARRSFAPRRVSGGVQSATLHTLGLAEHEPGVAVVTLRVPIAQTKRRFFAVWARTNVGNTLLFVTADPPSGVAFRYVTPR